MTVDIVIATYNRPDVCHRLVQTLSAHFENGVNKIIVVDSSETNDERYAPDDKIVYIKSGYKIQPYQRYLGYLVSDADILMFLDDDMEIHDHQFVSKVKSTFEEGVAGMNITFRDKHNDTVIKTYPKSVFSKLNKGSFGLVKFFRGLTGYPDLKKGEVSWNGLRGGQPPSGGDTDWFSGGAFAARREDLYRNFNFELYDLYYRKVGKGEDLMLSYTLSKQGRIVSLPDLLFLHNDTRSSVYTADYVSYGRRVAYSRMYLSMEYARLNGKGYALAKVKYHWYMLWRCAGMLINLTLSRKKSRSGFFKGSIHGWKEASEYSFSYIDNSGIWHTRALKDIADNKI